MSMAYDPQQLKADRHFWGINNCFGSVFIHFGLFRYLIIKALTFNFKNNQCSRIFVGLNIRPLKTIKNEGKPEKSLTTEICDVC